jgi:competence CoiA-like predicted nuclease
MPFTAQLTGTTRRVCMLDANDATVIADPRSAFECKACSTAMRIRRGTLAINDVARRPHFFHMPQPPGTERECAMLVYANGESEDHRRLKTMFAENLPKYLPALVTNPPTTTELECWLPECGRIADVYFETRSGHRGAVEIQLSPLPAEALEQRSRAYLGAEITPWWVFVDGQLTDTQQRVLDRLGLDRLILTLVRSREAVGGTV